MIVKVADTPNMLALAALAHGSNRSVHEDVLARTIDHDGIHVLMFLMLHNDCEWRTQWLVKIQGEEEPAEIWLDVPLDSLEKYTQEMIVEEEG